MERSRPHIQYKPDPDVPRQASGAQGAVIELGSTAIRCVVNNLPNQELPPIDVIKSRFRLAPAMGNEEPLRTHTQEDILYVLSQIRRDLKQYNITPEDLRVVCTSAFRDAETPSGVSKEGQNLIDRIARETGFKAEAISGQEEALFAAGGVAQYFPDGTGGVVDLGGRSTEVAFVKDGEPQRKHALSMPFGHTTIQALMDETAAQAKNEKIAQLTEEAKTIGDGIEVEAEKYAQNQAVAAARHEIYHHLKTVPLELKEKIKDSGNWFPIGGSFRKAGLAFMKAHEFKGCVVLSTKFRDSSMGLPEKNAEELIELGVPERKHETLPAAMLILDMLTKKLGARHVTISRAAVSDGIMRDISAKRQERLRRGMETSGFSGFQVA